MRIYTVTCDGRPAAVVRAETSSPTRSTSPGNEAQHMAFAARWPRENPTTARW